MTGLKYSIYDPKTGTMVRGQTLEDIVFDTIDQATKRPLEDLRLVFERCIYLRSIGKRDMRAADIYEGDIVRIKMYAGPPADKWTWEVGIIKYHEPSSGFKWFSLEDDPSDEHNYWLQGSETDGLEIIGNTYTTPELLK